jgi:mono/diheme cytochrome c family protein
MSNEYFKIDLQTLKENPGRVFGLIYPYLFIVIFGIGYFYMGNISNMTRNKMPVVATNVQPTADLTVQSGKEIPPVDVKVIGISSQELVDKGKGLYTTVCSSCHGENGYGDGAAGAVLNPKPRNFHEADGWKNGRKVIQLYKTLQEGIPGTAMPGYDYMTAEERFAIIHYVRSFMQNAPMDTPAEFNELDMTYNLSLGEKSPGQITVSGAKKLILNENEITVKKVNEIFVSISQKGKENNFSQLFENVTNNKLKAITSLLRNNIWKNSEREFIKYVTDNLNDNGFKGTISLLSNEELKGLQSFLKSLFDEVRS